MPTLELEARVDNLLATAQAETADIDLFAPILEREECSICMIPFDNDPQGTVFHSCCGKNICNGCIYKNLTKGSKSSKVGLCIFCRRQLEEDGNRTKVIKKLMKKNPKMPPKVAAAIAKNMKKKKK